MSCRELTGKKTRRLLAADLGLGEKGLDCYKKEIDGMLTKVPAAACALPSWQHLSSRCFVSVWPALHQQMGAALKDTALNTHLIA